MCSFNLQALAQLHTVQWRANCTEGVTQNRVLHKGLELEWRHRTEARKETREAFASEDKHRLGNQLAAEAVGPEFGSLLPTKAEHGHTCL